MVRSKRDSAHSSSEWFTEKEIERFRVYVEFKLNERGVSSNFKKLSPSDIEYIFHLYDSILFSGRIQSTINDNHSRLSFYTLSSVVPEGLMGLCASDREHGSISCNYEIHIPYSKFKSLFTKGERSHAASGINCNNRVQCLLITFEHELCHLIHYIFVDRDLAVKNRKYIEDHGELFKCLAKTLFYHNKQYHVLVEGVDSSKTLTKSTAFVGQYVERAGEEDNKCIITEITPKTAVLECFDLTNGKITLDSNSETYVSTYYFLQPVSVDISEQQAVQKILSTL